MKKIILFISLFIFINVDALSTIKVNNENLTPYFDKDTKVYNYYTNSDNNYINYYITDSEGNRSSVRSLNLDGFILENKIKGKEKKNYTITMWSDYNIEGNLKLLLNPVKV